VGGTVVAAVAEVGQRVARGAVLARLETTGIADQAISARSGVAAAQANYTVALRNAERADRLLAAGAIAARDAEQARAAATASRAQLEGARAQSAQASRQLGNATARAPFAGIVGIKRVSTGDVVNPGAELYTVVDPSSMQLEASVPAEQLAQVKVGAPVRFTVTGYGDRTFTGRITRVAPVADPTTRQVQILATLAQLGQHARRRAVRRGARGERDALGARRPGRRHRPARRAPVGSCACATARPRRSTSSSGCATTRARSSRSAPASPRATRSCGVRHAGSRSARRCASRRSPTRAPRSRRRRRARDAAAPSSASPAAPAPSTPQPPR
jgi:pyruvate/2-oxoglutarate dehydrogenase complex dihydrolipoamide acyltransferase (E2) component